MTFLSGAPDINQTGKILIRFLLNRKFARICFRVNLRFILIQLSARIQTSKDMLRKLER